MLAHVALTCALWLALCLPVLCMCRSSPYPVILSLEMHCSLPQQEKIATYLVEHLKSNLYIKPPRPATGVTPHLPSPKELMYKVLVKGRQLPHIGSVEADGSCVAQLRGCTDPSATSR